jgi:hypothetical protein
MIFAIHSPNKAVLPKKKGSNITVHFHAKVSKEKIVASRISLGVKQKKGGGKGEGNIWKGIALLLFLW